jgi:hypothetical protein
MGQHQKRTQERRKMWRTEQTEEKNSVSINHLAMKLSAQPTLQKNHHLNSQYYFPLINQCSVFYSSQCALTKVIFQDQTVNNTVNS